MTLVLYYYRQSAKKRIPPGSVFHKEHGTWKNPHTRIK